MLSCFTSKVSTAAFANTRTSKQSRPRQLVIRAEEEGTMSSLLELEPLPVLLLSKNPCPADISNPCLAVDMLSYRPC